MVTLPLLVLLAAAGSAQPQPPHPDDALATSAKDLSGLSRLSRHGTWNERIHAVHMLGRMGPAAVGALSEAARDADWQVRLGAVHWLGRQGRPAIAPLAWSLANDPCPIPRLAALHWLGSLGSDALPTMEEALGEDSRLLRLNQGYWKRKVAEDAGKPDAELAAADDLALRRDYDEDLEKCLRSLKPGIVEPRRSEAAAGDPVTDSARPRAPVLEEKLPPSPAEEVFGASSETLVGYETLAERAATEPPAPAVVLPGKTVPLEALSAPTTGTAEILSGTPGIPSKDELVRAEALLLGDGGTGLPPHDALPLLLAALRGGNERLKSRAADALGVMGEKAAAAAADLGAADAQVPALEKALKDKSAAVRHSAALSLGRIGTPRARKAFERYLRRRMRGG